MRHWLCSLSACLILGVPWSVIAQDPATKAPQKLAEVFPSPEDQGGWKTLLPESGIPDANQKAEIRKQAGIDWDKLAKAWDYNAEAPGNTGFVVIRHGVIVGEWYRGGDRKSEFNIYSSSKAYTSTAFGLILSDFGASATPTGKILSLDTKVCNLEWIPDSLPLPDPRKADATVRNFLNMASGLGTEAVPAKKPFEWSLGLVEGSPFAKLKGQPDTVFNYSNAGVSHLVLLFNKAAGTDLYPFLKEKLFNPIGIKQLRWQQHGGEGGIGPFSQGYSGIYTVPREHARFCQLALHRGEWAGKRIVPDSYYDFAWQGTKVNSTYGAQWWVYPRWKNAPKDLVMTSGRNHNDGFVLPSKDLIFVRLGDGGTYPRDFEDQLVKRVLDAVED
jgi:CubicO group peptidase (beta-lactamase class C family)